MSTSLGTYRLTILGKPYTFTFLGYGAELVKGAPRGRSREAKGSMLKLAMKLYAFRARTRIRSAALGHFIRPIRASEHPTMGRFPSVCGTCGQDGPGCSTCKRDARGGLRFEGADILGIVVRRLYVTVPHHEPQVRLAVVQVTVKEKDCNPVLHNALLVHSPSCKAVYFHDDSWSEKGMPRWRKQMVLFEEVFDDVAHVQGCRSAVGDADQEARGAAVRERERAVDGHIHQAGGLDGQASLDLR